MKKITVGLEGILQWAGDNTRLEPWVAYIAWDGRVVWWDFEVDYPLDVNHPRNWVIL